MEELNIIELIEKNPISKLSCTYNNKLLIKIKENFNDFEEKLFISSFYCYLNYSKKEDFVIDLDSVWKWMGFNQKIHSKYLLEKYFKIDIDYKDVTSFYENIEKNNQEEKKNGGQNKQTIMLTIKCFKSLCLKAKTQKADQIHEYYLKLEEIIQQTMEEETEELKIKLQQKDTIISEIKEITQKEKQQLLESNQKEKQELADSIKKEKLKAIEQTLMTQFPQNTECVYIGMIDNKNDSNEKLIKFGHTNHLTDRVYNHRLMYDNFILINAYRVQNKVEIENLIKTHPKIKPQIRMIEINEKNKTEIIAYDDSTFTIEKLSKYIKDIIHSKTYSIDNFNKLLQTNDELTTKNLELENKYKECIQEIEDGKAMITKQIIEINDLKETIEKQKQIINSIDKEGMDNTDGKIVYKNELLPDNETNRRITEFIDTVCIVRHDVTELSINLEGRFRIWNGVKPTSKMFHELKNYLDIRFKQKKLEGPQGYVGIKLKEQIYKKKFVNSTVENFIFQTCTFSDNARVLYYVLLDEYKKWKKSVSIEETPDDLKDIKDYLNECPYALRGTVWTKYGTNEGYYGLSLKKDDNDLPRQVGITTGKPVEKREVKTDNLLGKWETIAKAAIYEKISKTKMSTSVKNKVIFNDDYYYCLAK
jgi:hypothetical protein